MDARDKMGYRRDVSLTFIKRYDSSVHFLNTLGQSCENQSYRYQRQRKNDVSQAARR